MIIKNPQPYPSKNESWPTHIAAGGIHNTDTAPDIHAIPKREKAVLQEWMPPRPEEWTPPPYWRSLLHLEETKLERVSKRWFSRVLVAAMILYVLIITSIFLWKLLMIVIALK